MGAIKYSIVIPVYRNRESLPALLSRLADYAASGLEDLEALFIIDGSPDDCADFLKMNLANQPFSSQLIVLSRNFGSLAAVRTGLVCARGTSVAVMTADLQEPTHLIPDFFARLQQGDVDVVVGVRDRRDDPRISAFLSSSYWRLYRATVNKEIPAGGVDVFACTGVVAKEIARLGESHTSLIGLLYWVGFERAPVSYERQARHAGRSGWTLSRRVRYFLDSVYAFTDLPVLLLQVVGLIGIGISLCLGLVVAVSWALGAINEPGYTTLVLLISGATSAVLLGLGVVGSYAWRGYENTKQRPIAIVSETVNHLAAEGEEGAAS